MQKSKILIFLLLLVSFVVGAQFGLWFKSFEETKEIKISENLEEGIFTSKINIVAVSGKTGEGVLNFAEVEIRNGKGRILLNTNPFVEPDTQYSIEVASKVAQKFTNKSLANKDVIFNIVAQDVKLVGGPSAGAAFTLAIIAAIERKSIRNDITITGTINADGTIGQIAGVFEKAQAAANGGIKLFLVPKGQATAIFYERQIEEKHGPGFVFQRIHYVPVKVDLNEEMKKQYGMQVKEVGNISEASAMIMP